MAKSNGRERGTVKWFSAEKGYGFIACAGRQDVFVHWSGIRGEGFRELVQGEEVTFLLEPSKRSGKDNAVDVERIDA